jgi:hypothetical protein
MMKAGVDAMSADDEAIRSLAASVQDLHQEAVRQYTPVVEAILRSGSRDVGRIEHTLDGLLDFCGHAPALLLYRRLCRHYFEIDPVAAAGYVDAYRDFYDVGATTFTAPTEEHLKKVGAVRR